MSIQQYDKTFSGLVYRYISQDAIIIHNKYVKWKQELGENFCENICDFARLHINLYHVTNVTKYRSFQYRLLQRGLVTNVQLHKWKKRSDDLCTFCGQFSETTIHLLSQCSEVREIWTELNTYVKGRFNKEMELTDSNIICNCVVQPKNHVINFICLIFKQYVYRQRCSEQGLSFPAVKRLICKIESIEKYIAVKNNKSNVHERKWLVVDREFIDSNEYILNYNEQVQVVENCRETT